MTDEHDHDDLNDNLLPVTDFDADEETATWDDATESVVGPLQRAVSETGIKPYLFVLAGSRAGEIIRLTRPLTIGRGSDADFRVPDEGVSRRHVKVVELEDGTVILADEGSRNGTYVNGTRVQEAVLTDGDKIQIGSAAILKFSYADRLEASFQEKLFEAAQHDTLTQLFNRRYLVQQLETEYRFAERRSLPLCLLYFDLDHFKKVNDQHGHPVGDQVLFSFGNLLKKSSRIEDLAARIGGEEFALLCRDTQGAVGEQIAERIRRSAEQAVLSTRVPTLRVTISVGVAAVPDPRIGSPEQLIESADLALYEAKRGGRNQVILFE
jgi:two-component system cell cycle response regulator